MGLVLIIMALIIILFILNGMGYIQNLVINIGRYTQVGGADPPPASEPEPERQEEQQPELLDVAFSEQQHIAETEETVSRNICYVMPNKQFNIAGIITSWKFTAVKHGVIHMGVYRLVNNKSYMIIGENSVQIIDLGENIIKVVPTQQILFHKGDTIGFRFNDSDLVRSVQSPQDRTYFHNITEPIGTGQTINFEGETARQYDITTGYDQIYIPLAGTIGSSMNYPAKSAQHILDSYLDGTAVTSNISNGDAFVNIKGGKVYPHDGTYWIKGLSMSEPVQIYCNFSLRKGRGYMLVGSVSPNGGWSDIDSGNYPFNPHLSYGQYDPYGRASSYYMAWAKLDPSSILDTNPVSCNNGRFIYDNDGKYCKTSDAKRVNLKGGITEILFSTGNSRYWVVVNRADIEQPLGVGKMLKIDPLATSGNFDGQCDSNKKVYLMGKSNNKGDPWINMGDSYACGSNYMFWGEDGFNQNQEFKNANGGIQIYIGGSYGGITTKKFPHNPTYHTAPGKGQYQSTYDEALKVCSSLGKKICSVKQLKEANDQGYGKCQCGWTDTKKDKKRITVAYPTNIDIWAELQGDPVKQGWCGKPGINYCGFLEENQGLWGNTGADIYCCDIYDFSEGFKTLETPYDLGKLWITELEQKFEAAYGDSIPEGTSLVVFKDKYGLVVKKTSPHSYILISHPQGKAGSKGGVAAQIPEGGLGSQLSTEAIFLNDLSEYNIKANIPWSSLDSSLDQITYGSRFKINNNNRYLTGLSSVTTLVGKNPIVVGSDIKSINNDWIIKGASGLTDNHGSLVKNGDTIRLQHVQTNRYLMSTIAYKDQDGQEIALHNVDPQSDSDDFWRIEIVNNKYLASKTQFRLVHVNTGKTLTTLQKPVQVGVEQMMKVSATPARDDMSLLTTTDVRQMKIQSDKCKGYIDEIIKARQLLRSGRPMTDDLYKSITILKDTYDTECYKISQNAFNSGINPQLEKIRYEMTELDKQLNIYKQYHTEELQLSEMINKEENIAEAKQSELEDLLHKSCLPVKKCVNDVGKSEVAKTCRSLTGLMGSHEINDDLIEQIKTVRRKGDRIDNYDIRNHKDFYKLAKSTNVNICN